MALDSNPTTIWTPEDCMRAVGLEPGTVKGFIPQSPTPRQRLFLDLDQEKEVFYGGAAGGGKSSCLLMAALKYVDVKGYSALLLRRTYADLSKQGALMDRAKEWLTGTGAQWNEQKKTWTFPSGARIAFGYLETENDKFQYQGAEYQFIGFDELTQFSQSQYTYLFSRLRRLKDSNIPIRMRSASNPGGVGANWVKERFVPETFTPEDALEERVWLTEAEDEETGELMKRFFVPARLDDNPHLDQAEYELSLRELDPVTRAQLRRGDWQITVRGDILYMWSEPHVIITWSQFEKVFGTRHIPFHWKLGVFQDWGCLTLDTDILTKEGWKRHSELKIGELVAAYDWQNKREIVWTPLRHIVYKSNQPLVTMKNKSFCFTATPDHCWITKRRKKGSRVRDTYTRQRLDTVPKSGASFVIAGYCNADGELDVSPCEAALLGWLVTDGWISCGIAYLCQKNYCDALIADLEGSGLGWKELREKPNEVRIFRLTKESYADLCQRSGFDGKGSLATLVTRLSPEARRAMLDAMLLAEGTNNGTSRKAIFCQKDGPVSDAFQILATLCGVRLGVQRDHQSQWGTSKRIPLLRTQNIDYPDITEVEGLHDVWCPTVDEGAVVARQNGQITITGNTTEGHPCVTKWFATAAENSPRVNDLKMAGSVFVYRSMLETQCTAREVKQKIYNVMMPHNEIPRVQYWEMSHEASSERMEYRRTDEFTPYALPFRNWATGKTRGIEQFKYALTLEDTDKKHPFKDHLFGRPKIYFIVDDAQEFNPRDEAGMLRIRAEAPAYRWDVPKSGETALRLAPYSLFNDAIDVCRGAAARYFPTEALKSAEERVDELIPDAVKIAIATARTGEQKLAAGIVMDFEREIAERQVNPWKDEWEDFE